MSGRETLDEARAADEAELQVRDERVRGLVVAEVSRLREAARVALQVARDVERSAAHIERAAQTEQWWLLEGVVSAADIESLCECSPVRLLDEVDERNLPVQS